MAFSSRIVARQISVHITRALCPRLPTRCKCTSSMSDKESTDAKVARKAAKKAVKEARRLQRAGLGDVAHGQKPCTLCSRSRDLLIRCQVDDSRVWHMVCGKCWLQASGGAVDGSASHPHYRYGGLWKNHHKAITGKNKVPAAAQRSSPTLLGGQSTAALTSELLQALQEDPEDTS